MLFILQYAVWKYPLRILISCFKQKVLRCCLTHHINLSSFYRGRFVRVDIVRMRFVAGLWPRYVRTYIFKVLQLFIWVSVWVFLSQVFVTAAEVTHHSLASWLSQLSMSISVFLLENYVNENFKNLIPTQNILTWQTVLILLRQTLISLCELQGLV